MSYLQQVVQDGPNHYVLPVVGAMKTPVHAFLSPALFAGTDETLWRQAAESASQEGAIGMYLMPDVHIGYGIPVGGVLVTDGTIVQAGSGYDISCGVLYARLDGLHASDVASWEKRKAWVDAVERHVATGMGVASRMSRVSERFVEDVLRNGALALAIDTRLCERPRIPVDENVDLRAIGRARDKAGLQLGSVGSGNHFVELQVDRDDGSVWVMVHCGSRGFGWQAANYFFRAGAALRGLPNARREESWLRIDEPLGREYWAWHNAAANYAVANRWRILDGLREATRSSLGVELVPFYEISHNLVQEETLVLPDGTTTRGFVHRKGATRAFPAGHPDLVGTKWADTGHPCLIPGSMLDGAAVLFPLNGAYRSGCSVNHGSGRTMGRHEAKEQLVAIHDYIDDEMRTTKRVAGGAEIVGIVGNTARTPLDECGYVYKKLDDVLDVLVDEGIARIERRLFPVANLKGMD